MQKQNSMKESLKPETPKKSLTKMHVPPSPKTSIHRKDIKQNSENKTPSAKYESINPKSPSAPDPNTFPAPQGDTSKDPESSIKKDEKKESLPNSNKVIDMPDEKLNELFLKRSYSREIKEADNIEFEDYKYFIRIFIKIDL